MGTPAASHGRRRAVKQFMTTVASSEVRVFHTSHGSHLFMVDGSRIYEVDPGTAHRIEQSLTGDSQQLVLPEAIGRADTISRKIGPEIPAAPRVHSISLNVAQSCNMSCLYCYADEGRFGRSPRLMNQST